MISRLKEFGSEGFQSHELLEMMLYSSFKQCDTNPIVHRLIDRFGTLSGVFSASENELCEVEGVGRSTAQMIIVLRANIERMLSESVQKGDARRPGSGKGLLYGAFPLCRYRTAENDISSTASIVLCRRK